MEIAVNGNRTTGKSTYNNICHRTRFPGDSNPHPLGH